MSPYDIYAVCLQSAKPLIRAFVLPILDYASPLCRESSHSKEHSCFQNCVARWICGSKFNLHSNTWTKSSSDCCHQNLLNPHLQLDHIPFPFCADIPLSTHIGILFSLIVRIYFWNIIPFNILSAPNCFTFKHLLYNFLLFCNS